MGFLIISAKIFATFLLVVALLVSITKAHPKTHNPEYPPLAEYGSGFIMFFAALCGLYFLWFN